MIHDFCELEALDQTWKFNFLSQAGFFSSVLLYNNFSFV